MTEAAVDREIQGLFSLDVKDRSYGTLLARVLLAQYAKASRKIDRKTKRDCLDGQEK